MLIRNTAVNVVSLGASLVLGFLTTAILASSLGPAAFGLLMLVRSIVGNVGILESLFGAGITRYVALYTASEELDERDTFIWAGLAVNLAQGIVVSLLVVGVSSALFDDVFSGMPADLLAIGPMLLTLFFIVFLVQLCSLALSRALEGLQAYPALRASEVLVQLLLLLLLWATVRRWPDAPLYRIAGVYLVAEIIRLVLFVLWGRRLGLLRQRARIDLRAFKALFTFGKPIAIAKLFTILSYRSDAILLGIFATLQVIADYQIASQIWSATVAGLSALTVALLPAIAHRTAGGANVGGMFITASRYTLAVALCLATLVIYGRDLLLMHWVGPQYYGASVLILLFMAQLVVAYHQGVSNQFVLGTNRHQPVGWYEGLGSIVNLTISLLLIQRLGAVALLIGAIVKAFIVMPLNTNLALRAIDLSRAVYVREAVWPVWRFFAAVLTVVALLHLGGLNIGSDPMWLGIVQLTVLAAAMATLFWIMILTAEDRRRVARAVAF